MGVYCRRQSRLHSSVRVRLPLRLRTFEEQRQVAKEQRLVAKWSSVRTGVVRSDFKVAVTKDSTRMDANPRVQSAPKTGARREMPTKVSVYFLRLGRAAQTQEPPPRKPTF